MDMERGTEVGRSRKGLRQGRGLRFSHLFNKYALYECPLWCARHCARNCRDYKEEIMVLCPPRHKPLQTSHPGFLKAVDFD